MLTHLLRYRRLVTMALLALAFALRASDALRRPLENDEGLTLSLASMPWDKMLQYLGSDVHPPLYFALLHWALQINAPLWAVRLAMAALGVASVWLFVQIVRLWATEEAALIAGFCAAFMPSLVYYDTWVRMYGLYSFLVLLAFLFVSRLAKDSQSGGKTSARWVGWVLANAAALYVLYLAWFSLATQLLFAGLSRRPRLLFWVGIGTALSVIIWLPQAQTFVHQLAIGGVAFSWSQAHLASALVTIPSQATLVPELEGPTALAASGVVIMWTIAAFAFAWTDMRRSFLPWLGAPALLTLLFSLLAHKDLYLDRYYLIFAYALAAWTGVSLVRVLRTAPRIGSAVSLTVAVVLIGCGSEYAFNPSLYTADWPRVASILDSRAKPSDLVIFEQGQAYSAFRYYQGSGRYTILLINDSNAIKRTAPFVDQHRRVWLIGNEVRAVDPDLLLVNRLQSRYRLAYFEEADKMIPSEDVSIGLFER